MDDLVDFSDNDGEIIQKEEKILKYNSKFDDQTEVFYKNMRQMKYNTFTYESFSYPIEYSFQFKFMWDPYTGIRDDVDIFGPLYFDPDELINYYYKKRLNMLWNEQKSQGGIQYSGYFGDALGSGENIFIKGRGYFPELHLFRLPVDDCYLSKNYDMSIVTLGPILSDDEIKEIDYLANTYHKNNFYNRYKKQRPSLMKIKELYNIAIDGNVEYLKNKEAVEELIRQ